MEEWFLNYKPDQIKNKELNDSEKNSIKSDNANAKKYKNVKNLKKTKKTNKNLFFNIYGKRTRKNKKGLY